MQLIDYSIEQKADDTPDVNEVLDTFDLLAEVSKFPPYLEGMVNPTSLNVGSGGSGSAKAFVEANTTDANKALTTPKTTTTTTTTNWLHFWLIVVAVLLFANLIS